MKKMFLSMLAAVTLFASCSQEDVVSQQQSNGEESLVSFTLTTPELGSRGTTAANGDGQMATDLYYAVYDETTGEIVAPISKTADADKDAIAVGTPKEIKLPLLNGHKYSLVFWAENAGCPYSVNWEEKAIALDANASLKSNQEAYDAFYAYVEPFVVSGHQTETVTLYRPFAQLNIATSEGDLNRVVEYYGLDAITKTQIEVTTPTAMDLTTGNVYDEKPLTYAMEAFDGLLPETGLFPATVDPTIDGDYVAISLSYLLVSAEKNLVDIKMSCDSGSELDKEFKNVPVQRNYRTNIYGNLYTSQSVWNVVIEPEFDGALEPADQLAAVFENGGEVTLYTDVELTEPLILKDGKEVTINLNGQTITSGVFTENANGEFVDGDTDSFPFYVKGGTLNIKGEGRIEATVADPLPSGNHYSMAVYATGGTVNIYDGEYYNAGDACDLIYAAGTAQINIYGGYFQATENTGAQPGTKNAHSALNIKGNAVGTADITVYGGTFYGFDPAENVSDTTPTNYLADGYSSVEVGDCYVVTEGIAVADAEGLVAAWNAAQDGDIITLANNIDLAGAPLILNEENKEVTLNLNGKNITADIFAESAGTISAGTSDSYAFWVKAGTLNITGEGIVKTQACQYSIAVFAMGTDAVVNIAGGEYYNAGEGSDLIYAKNGAVINISGGTFKANKKQEGTSGTNEPYSALNLSDNTGASIVVTGGKFYQFNPADNLSEGANTNFVATGYKSTQAGDWWVVTEE